MGSLPKRNFSRKFYGENVHKLNFKWKSFHFGCWPFLTSFSKTKSVWKTQTGNIIKEKPYTKLIQNKNSKFWVLGVIYRKPNASIYNLFIISTVIILFILFYISVSTYQKYKCVEVTECKLYMRVNDTNNYKRDNPVSMTRRIQNTMRTNSALTTYNITTIYIQ